MNNHQNFNTIGEQGYLDLLQHILDNGYKVDKERTGTGTIVSPTPHQLHFPNVAEEFPLFTTKYVSFNMLACEMLWFISGSTNADDLRRIGSPAMAATWMQWAEDNGELGPVYGYNWRNFGKTPESIPQPEPKLPEDIEATYLGVANGSGKEGHSLGKVWEGMIARCYDTNSNSYHLYGEKGVHVIDRWLQFENFAEDAIQLKGYNEKVNSDNRYVLDKDIQGTEFTYGKDYCCWITDQQNALAQSDTLYTVKKDGVEYQFTNPTQFCEKQGIPNNNFSDLWTGSKNAKVRHGFTLVKTEKLNKGVDQLQNVIDNIKNNPYSRRHRITAWNPELNKYMALPPCHVEQQYTVEPIKDGKDRLHLHLLCRSQDMLLGTPFNIAQYSLLLMMVAQVTNTIPGDFTWTGINCHIYQNHVKAVKEQLKRVPRDSPKVILHKGVENIDDFEIGDMTLIGYKHHPKIKAEVSV